MSQIGIIVALRAEARCITQRRLFLGQTAALDENLLIRISGMGNAAARHAATALCHQKKIAGLISFGVAGALDDDLQAGDLILPETVVLADRSYPTDNAWCARIRRCLPNHINVVRGTLATSDAVLATGTAKRTFATRSGGCAVDMESGVIAAVAAEEGVPFLAIRAISDPVLFSPPAALMDALHPDGSVRPLSLLALLLKRSFTLNELLRLAPGMRAACNTLKQVVQATRHELGRQVSVSAKADAANFLA